MTLIALTLIEVNYGTGSGLLALLGDQMALDFFLDVIPGGIYSSHCVLSSEREKKKYRKTSDERSPLQSEHLYHLKSLCKAKKGYQQNYYCLKY